MHHIYARCTSFITHCNCHLVDARVEVFLERRHRRDVLLAFAREHLRDTGSSSTRRGQYSSTATDGGQRCRAGLPIDAAALTQGSAAAHPIRWSACRAVTAARCDRPHCGPEGRGRALSNLMRSSERSFSSLVRSFSALSSSYRCNSRSVGRRRSASGTHLSGQNRNMRSSPQRLPSSIGSPILRSAAFVSSSARGVERCRRVSARQMRSMPTGQDRRAAQPQCSAVQCSAVPCRAVWGLASQPVCECATRSTEYSSRSRRD